MHLLESGAFSFPGAFLGYRPTEETPTYVTLGNTRKRLLVEVHQSIFTSALAMPAKEGMLKRKTLGVDVTTLEANAAFRSIIRKHTGYDYQEYCRKLSATSGIEMPTKEELILSDRSRKGKKMSNDKWKHPHGPDARIGMTKQGARDSRIRDSGRSRPRDGGVRDAGARGPWRRDGDSES